MPGSTSRSRPLRFLRILLGRVLPAADREHLLEEIDTLYRTRRERGGRLRAELWYLRTLAGFVARLGSELVTNGLRGLIADQAMTGRVLWRRRKFAAATILTLAVGLAGITTVHSIANWVLLRPVPGLAEQEELVALRLGSTDSERPSWHISHLDLLALRDGIAGLRSLEASRPFDANLSAGERLEPLRVEGAVVTGGWFETLGVRFAAGRALSRADRPELAAADEVVVDHDLARLLAGDAAAAVGRSLVVNGNRFTVVGVTEAGFRGHRFPGTQRIWLGSGSMTAVERGLPTDLFSNGYRRVWRHLVGRLAEGAEAATVADEANRVKEQVKASGQPNAFFVNHFTIQVTSRLGLDYGLQASVGRLLLLLGAGALFLLLLAVTNATNLGLTDAASRRSVHAIQRALGIERSRLVGQVLGEYLLMGLVAGVLTVALVAAGSSLLRGIQLDEFGGALSGLVVEPRVAVTAAAVAVAAALLAGIGPALLACRQSVVTNLGVAGSGSRRARRVRDLLIVVQVALSIVLLVGAALMGRTVARLNGTDLGFDPSGIVAFSVDPEDQGYSSSEIEALLGRLSDAIEAHPGVEVGFVFPQPLRSSFLTSWLYPSSEGERDSGSLGAHLQVSGAFLEVSGARVLAGETDLARWSRGPADGRRTVVLSRTAAADALPDREVSQVPGATLWTHGPDRELVPVEVVAVIEDLEVTGALRPAPGLHVWPWAQAPFDGPAVGWVRAPEGMPTGELIRQVRQSVGEVDPTIPAYGVETVEQRLSTITAPQHVVAGLSGAVSSLGLFLAAIGLYAVLSYAQAERRREIGIRSALGASRGELVRSVLAGGLGRVALGLVPGLLGALAASRWLESLLYEIGRFDLPAYAGSVALLVTVALAASWLPARRAGEVPPSEVLRVDA